MTETGGQSPKPSGYSRDVDLFGTMIPEPRPGWRIEITGVCPANPPGVETATMVTYTLVNADTGQRIGRTTTPFQWLRDVAMGSTTVIEIREGDFR
jgi:hypothetical protein